MQGPLSCPQCGKPQPAGALEGLCPACLLAQGAATQGDSHRETPEGRFVPPALEEVARLFPQLEIISLIGAGGMGAVYKARQPALDRLVALKLLPTTGPSRAGFADRFNREARALARLNHPHIVTVFEFGQTSGQHFFIMEFVDGVNLRQLEQRGRLSPREALQIIPQMCDALQYAHDEDVVHRDIKPENVLVDRKGRVKIADFGLAKMLEVDPDAARLTKEGQVMGTPHYMAPEQVERPLSVDHRADIYSLGVVFYEMLTGDLPLGKFAPPSRKVELDVRLDEVVLRSLENDPNRRYQRASEVKTRVEIIAGSQSASTPDADSDPSEASFLRWGGFPLVREQNGVRQIQGKAIAHAAAIVFGVLTLVFGIASLATGQSAFGWLGIVGWPGLIVRLAATGLLVAWGVGRAYHRANPSDPPRTAQGTIILQPERWSWKAIVGACWAALFFIAAFLWYGVVEVRTGPEGAASEPHQLSWWPMLLNVTLWPFGITAPLGATILGWLAVADIRRARGRLIGLGLALGDGLLFPMLAFNALLFSGIVQTFYGFIAHAVPPTFVIPSRQLVALAAALICLLVDFLIIRRVWKAVAITSHARPADATWWWSTKEGGVSLVLLVLLILGITASLRESRSSPQTSSVFPAGPRKAPRYEPDGSTPAASNSVAPISDQTRTRRPTEVAAGSTAADWQVSPAKLMFLAWQDDWDDKGRSAVRAVIDGRTIQEPNPFGPPLQAPPVKCLPERTANELARPRFLHFWFSHPLFDQNSLVSLVMTDHTGLLPVRPGASGLMGSAVQTAGELQEELGWLMVTLSPNLEPSNDVIHLRLDYAVGPLENFRHVAPDFMGGMSLEGNSQLSALGVNADGQSFVTLAVDAAGLGMRQFGVMARSKDGRDVAAMGTGNSGVPGELNIARCVFDVPLSEVEYFMIGTRPVRRQFWKNIALPITNH